MHMFANPKSILEEMSISPGAIVVDLGSGSGAYALPAAKIVSANGEAGKVYAVDVQKDLLDRLKVEAGRENIKNIEVIWGNFEKLKGSTLPDHIADVVIISNVIFQIADHATFVQEISRIAKPSARVVSIEWTDLPFVVTAEHHPLTKIATQSLFEKAGFVLEKEINAGSHHYGLILRKK